MSLFWEGFEKRASTLEERRKALEKVREILKPHGDFFVVTDGASITRTSKPGIIKDLRGHLKNYEKSVGEDPSHDWSKR